jgi:hypothetical protein
MCVRVAVSTLGLVAFLAAGPGEASSQEMATTSVGVFGGYHAVGGSDFQSVDPGLAVEGTVRYTRPNGLTLGGFGARSSHTIEGNPENLSFLSFGGELGYAFLDVHPAMTPFLAGRAGYRKWAVDAAQNGASIPVEASGFAGGGTAALSFRVSAQLAVEIGAQAWFMTFGNSTSVGVIALDSETNGTSVGASLGIQWVLP